MTYYVSSGTLNSTNSTQLICLICEHLICCINFWKGQLTINISASMSTLFTSIITSMSIYVFDIACDYSSFRLHQIQIQIPSTFFPRLRSFLSQINPPLLQWEQRSWKLNSTLLRHRKFRRWLLALAMLHKCLKLTGCKSAVTHGESERSWC